MDIEWPGVRTERSRTTVDIVMQDKTLSNTCMAGAKPGAYCCCGYLFVIKSSPLEKAIIIVPVIHVRMASNS
jgi:hypothetical protein